MEVSWKTMLVGGVVIVLLIGLCYTQREIINLKKEVNKDKKDNFEKTPQIDQTTAKKDSKWAP